MTWWQVAANGIPFLVVADTLEQAITTASVHLAWLSGGRTIERVTRLA